MDTDNSGAIEANEFAKVIENLIKKHQKIKQQISEEHVKKRGEIPRMKSSSVEIKKKGKGKGKGKK